MPQWFVCGFISVFVCRHSCDISYIFLCFCLFYYGFFSLQCFSNIYIYTWKCFNKWLMAGKCVFSQFAEGNLSLTHTLSLSLYIYIFLSTLSPFLFLLRMMHDNVPVSPEQHLSPVSVGWCTKSSLFFMQGHWRLPSGSVLELVILNTNAVWIVCALNRKKWNIFTSNMPLQAYFHCGMWKKKWI